MVCSYERMRNVTHQVSLPALRGCLDLLLNQYRPSLALDEDRLREAMRDFERDAIEHRLTLTQGQLAH